MLRDQVSHHADHIADLEQRLSAANARIAEQQRLLSRLLETRQQEVRKPDSRGSESFLPAASPVLPPRRASAAQVSAVQASRVAVLPTPLKPAGDGTAPARPARVPASAKPRVHIGVTRAPQISEIAGAVLLARDTSRPAPRLGGPSEESPTLCYRPTRGVVQAAHESNDGGTDGETTLTLNREELTAAHRSLSRRRSWFPFGRRRD